ncbi:MAG: rod shape-determining protein MreD [Acidobacteriaceae bacterium]|nr:rod shape-determining protein MreD [Acidobacteriaceae bacterium]
MKALRLGVGIVVALVVQTTLARYLAGGRVVVDFVLVAVMYAALADGPLSGLWAGTVAGLVQDALGSGVIGIGGLSKTIVGFLAGIVGTQFIVAQSPSRFVVFFLGSLLHSILFMGLYVLLGLRTFEWSPSGVLGQALATAVIGTLVFALGEFLPGAIERRRAGRGPRH